MATRLPFSSAVAILTVCSGAIAQLWPAARSESTPASETGAATGPSRVAAMDISEVEIMTYKARIHGDLFPPSYGFRVEVTGTNIESITVQTPNNTPLVLTRPENPENHWQYQAGDFANLCAIETAFGFGNFAFALSGVDLGTDSLQVTYDPGCASDPHSGYAQVTYPVNGQVDVPLAPTLTWTCAEPPCGSFAWYMELYATVADVQEFEADILDPEVTQWAPGVLAPSTDYEFWISAGTILGGVPQSLMTNGGDPFVYPPGFETGNVIGFTTTAVAAGPGAVPPTIRLQRVAPDGLQVSWEASTCTGATDYGIYAGLLGDWANYGSVDCHDDDNDLTENLLLPDMDLFFLVVPFNQDSEGSYGTVSSSVERLPAVFATCAAVQSLSCP